MEDHEPGTFGNCGKDQVWYLHGSVLPLPGEEFHDVGRAIEVYLFGGDSLENECELTAH